ncbi:hypothetical protein Vretimale_12841 [Volvox reticuliferus]|nr:hypothetical protein Vretimale_12841 [Volvox reticuliferus]
MSIAGPTLQPSCSFRSATLFSTPPAPADSSYQPMRRGLPLLQQLALPCQQCFLGSTPGAPIRSRISARMLPRMYGAYGSRPASEGPLFSSPGGAPYEQIDRALLNAKRNAEEARRLSKNYESISAAQLRRAQQAALGPAAAMATEPTTNTTAGPDGWSGEGRLAKSLMQQPPAVLQTRPLLLQQPLLYQQVQQQQQLQPQLWAPAVAAAAALGHDHQPLQLQPQQQVMPAAFSDCVEEQLQPRQTLQSPAASQSQQTLLLQPRNGHRQFSTLAPEPGGCQAVPDVGFMTANHQINQVDLVDCDDSKFSKTHHHHHYQRQQQQQQVEEQQGRRPGQGEEVSEILSSVLWDGYIRSPEQTIWMEASTSGGGGGAAAADAVRGLLGSRRHKASARAEAVALARRTYQPLRREAALPYNLARAAAPCRAHNNGNGSVRSAAESVEIVGGLVSQFGVVEKTLASGDGCGLEAGMLSAAPSTMPLSVPYTGVRMPTPVQDSQYAKDSFVLDLKYEQQEMQVQDHDATAPPKARKSRTKKRPTDVAGKVVEAEAAITDDVNPTDAAIVPSAKRTRRKRPTVAANGTVSDGVGSGGGAPTVAGDVDVVPTAAPPPEEVKPYLQEGLRPLRPPVAVPGFDGYFEACEGYCTKQPLMYDEPQDVLIVNTPEVARAVVDKLVAVASKPYPNNRINPSVPCRYFGCDTEVAFIDVSSETPIGHGAVLCLSIYGGDDLDFADCEGVRAAAASASHGSVATVTAAATGAPPPSPSVRKDRIWVDVWDEVELDQSGRPIMDGRYVRLKPQHPILDEFKRFFEDDNVKKVWHNYGFDRHVLENMGIRCRGFGGDTLHMARLADASRSGKRTYGLDNLTADKDIMRHFVPNKAEKAPRELMGNARRAARFGGAAAVTVQVPPPPSGPSPGDKRAAEVAKLVRAKISMKDRFGLIKIRNGVPGKVPELPAMQLLHTLELFRPSWIDYSALDAKATWQLREALEGLLRLERWELEPSLARKLGYDTAADRVPFLHLWHFYCSYWLDFGELLTEMERRGMMVNRHHLAEAQKRAEADKEAATREFLEWADSKVPGARYMNAHSGLQIRMLLFPDYPGYVSKAAAAAASKVEAAARRATRKAAGGGGVGGGALLPPPGTAVAAEVGDGEDGGASGEDAAAAAVEKSDMLPSGCRVIKVPNPQYEEQLAQGKRVSRYTNLELHGIWGRGVPGRLQPEILTDTNAAAVSIKVLRGLAGKPGAARKELAKLLEARAAAAADSRAAAEAARVAEAAARVPIVEDVLDETLQELTGTEETGTRAGSEAEEAAVAADGDEGEEVAADSARLGPVPVVDDPVLMAALEKEAKDKGLGRLYAACGGGEEGLRACIAVEALCEISAIDKLLSAFIIPLQSDDTSTTQLLPASSGSDSPTRAVHRVHCSLNINTETGRLSARRPNLQNQPALEKDRYKVRKAFTADTESGNTLVVADYGQLELRILAHMTDCKSMKEAFELGGDFHSRTAYGMYDYIQEAVRNGECYLEWEGQGEPDKPLVKDKYAAERRKAKVLNFSIAYGKTAHGLAADFKTTTEEAQETVNKWYSDRWEVRKWQEDTRKEARQEGKVRTLLGRTRPLPNINSLDFKLSGHSNRAAINTPIQGSAADVAARHGGNSTSPRLCARRGFKLLMQIHDEVILEGPRHRSEDAKHIVMALMANPWAELSRHWNSPGAIGLMQGPDWQ